MLEPTDFVVGIIFLQKTKVCFIYSRSNVKSNNEICIIVTN